jgi:isocitrate dehydrogenase
MDGGDFRSNEKSVTMKRAGTLRVELVAADGNATVLKERVPVLEGEIVDATMMSVARLEAFIEDQIADARRQGTLFAVHLKATMMKVSDPIIFGHVVHVYFREVFEKHGPTLRKLGVNPNNGMAALHDAIGRLPDPERQAIERDIEAVYGKGPGLAMVNSDKGITNLHVPSDVIIDASMPAMIRTSGQM